MELILFTNMKACFTKTFLLFLSFKKAEEDAEKHEKASTKLKIDLKELHD